MKYVRKYYLIVGIIIISLFICNVIIIGYSLNDSAVAIKESVPRASGGIRSQVSEGIVEKYLGRLESCGGVRMGDGSRLVLEYRFVPAHSPLIVEYGGRDYVGDTSSAVLRVVAVRRGEGYEVVFEFRYRGEAQRPKGGGEWESVRLDVRRVVRALYKPGSGYVLPNGTRLGYVFPLFMRGRELVLGVVWAGLGEEYTLGGVGEAVAERRGLTVFDLGERLVMEYNGSRGAVAASFDSLPDPGIVERYVERLGGLRELGGCGGLVGVVHYASRGLAVFAADVDYATGVPVFIVMDGAARYRPGGDYVRNGVKMDRMPASVLAVLLRLRSVELALELVNATFVGG